MFRFFIAALAALTAVSAAAQGHAPRDPRRTDEPAQTRPADQMWQFWLKGNGQYYENFFQAVEGQPEDNVTSYYGEAGASMKLSRDMRVYGSAQYMRYDDAALDSTNGVRLGLRRDAQPQSFDVYAEQLNDRPTFDVGEEYDRATIRNLVADYSYRVSHDWQVGVDGELQQQEYKLTTNRDNKFAGVGASVRWRGSRLFSPEIGVRVGNRDVDDERENYDQRDAYLQIRSSITPKLYLSFRFRDRLRDYTTDFIGSSNVGREDTRRQVAVGADYTVTPSWIVNLYGAREKNDSNLTGKDFTTGFWLAGLTWRY